MKYHAVTFLYTCSNFINSSENKKTIKQKAHRKNPETLDYSLSDESDPENQKGCFGTSNRELLRQKKKIPFIKHEKYEDPNDRSSQNSSPKLIENSIANKQKAYEYSTNDPDLDELREKSINSVSKLRAKILEIEQQIDKEFNDSYQPKENFETNMLSQSHNQHEDVKDDESDEDRNQPHNQQKFENKIKSYEPAHRSNKSYKEELEDELNENLEREKETNKRSKVELNEYDNTINDEDDDDDECLTEFNDFVLSRLQGLSTKELKKVQKELEILKMVERIRKRLRQKISQKVEKCKKQTLKNYKEYKKYEKDYKEVPELFTKNRKRSSSKKAGKKTILTQKAKSSLLAKGISTVFSKNPMKCL